MGRPRTPTPQLKLHGAFDKDPQRERIDPLTAGPLGGPPESFSEPLVAIWHEVERQAPLGVLSIADRWIVEIACQLMLRFRTVGVGLGMTSAELNLLVSYLSRLGMTPSDRSRVGVQSKKERAQERDELAELAAETLDSFRLPN